MAQMKNREDLDLRKIKLEDYMDKAGMLAK